MVKQYSLARSGLEVYKTSDSNIVKENKSSEESDNLVLHNGSINEISYFADMLSISFDQDYEGISSNGDISFQSVNNNLFYKGVKLCLKKEWEDPGTSLKWDDLKTVLLGFITDQSYSTDEVNLKISGMDKLLEKKHKFDFKNTKRSEIIKQMVETAGLKCKISVKGLNDDKIDYTNVSSGSSSDMAGGEGETIDSLAASICQGLTDDLAKAKAIHQWLIENVSYSYYPCSHHSTPEDCLKHKSALNCADTSRLTAALMRSAGLNPTVVHGPNHFWTIVTINGKEYASDATSKSRKFNQVLRGYSYYAKCGKNPSC